MKAKRKSTTRSEIVLDSFIRLNNKLTRELCAELAKALHPEDLVSLNPPFEILLKRLWALYKRLN